ncbi:amino acid adenylation domain-containing protein, partial [Streptomyces sp. CC219B]|uniref:amino acid adenylation domain-containing protein n=1 Tax=Streptomyces sp. CC219B TaxID=3044574 RepID=UPI0024A9771F
MIPAPRTQAPAETALVPELVARQAARTPGATAVLADGVRMSYGELDRRSAGLAGRLRELGAGPEAPVGILLGRSGDLVVALLAVLRAGAPYLALDAGAPQSRLDALVTASGTRLILCDPATSKAGAATGAAVVRPAESGEPVAVRPAEAGEPVAVRAGLDGQDAAYILHTSGSTGTPKGVVVPHQGLAAMVNGTADLLRLTPEDRVLHRTPLVFDAHVWEIFAPLIRGAAVVLAPDADRDPATVLHTITEQQVSVVQAVPTIWRQMVLEDGWDRCTTLRALVSGGERLSTELADRLAELSGAEVWNVYGPTECTVNATAYRFTPGAAAGDVPIGRPLPRTRVLVTDTAGTPVGIGVPGELLIGGVQLARGYLHRPDQTAERFVPDPIAQDGSRLYRTGDRVRWRADGQLEYLGRIDEQLKVNGVRLEPAEVEAALLGHPGVAAAAVAPYTAAGDTQQLAAYVVRAPGAERDVPLDVLLRGHLIERLPSTHLPALFVELDDIPRTTSGKTDRRALPHPLAAPTADQTPAAGDRTAPSTAAQLLIAEAWRDLLKPADDLAVQDDFFRLGGTSLQLTRLVTRLRATTGREVTLQSLLGATTLAAQAELIDGAAATPQAPIARADRSRGLPLSYEQRRLWFMDKLNPASPEWVAGLLLKLPADATREHAETALNALIARHEALRTAYTEEAGEPRQHILPEVRVELPETGTDRDALPGHLVTLLGRGFALDGTEPLLRARLFDLGDGRRIVAVALHHITTDGWSTAVLEREFAELIGAAVRGTEPVLPQLAVQYADYAVWQREHLTDAAVADELAHWREVLDGLEPLELPTDRPRPAVRDGRGSIVPFTVPAATARRLDEVARQAGTTRFAVVLTAFATVLARHTGQWDIPVGTPVAGRGRAELDGVVGFFLNNVVLRCRLDPAQDFARAVAGAGEVTKDAFAHQELPFDLLVDALVPDRDLSRTPLFQVAVDLHDEDFNGPVDEDFETIRQLWRITHTDLTLLLRPDRDGGLTGGLEFATSLFDETTARRLADHLGRLLAAAVQAPATPLDDLDMVPTQELERLDAWGSGG